MKKLLCLALCLVMVMSMFLVGCNKKTDFGDDIGEEEEEVRNAITLKFHIVTDDVTTEDAKDAMQDAFNAVARAKYSTQVEFVFNTSAEYKASIDKALSDAKASFASAEKLPSAVYEGYVPETVLDEFNLPELVYPEAQENQIDIILITDKEMLEEYIAEDYLEDITPYINGNNSSIKEYINTSLLTNTKIQGKWYAVPNNVVVGNYEYLLINKELASNYYLVESDFTELDADGNTLVNYTACLDFAKSIANDDSLTNVAPVKEQFDYPAVKFWSDNGDSFALATFYSPTTGLGDYISVYNVFENENYIDYLKFVAEAKNNGYFATTEAEVYGINVVTDDYASRFAYEEDNFVVVLDNPRVYSTDGFDAMFAVTKYTASAARSMELIEDLVTDSELCNILLYGVEGSDYYYNDDGTVTKISDTYKMNNKYVGNVFMTYPCTNDGMFADYWRYGMYQNQEASSEPLEGCDSSYVWSNVRKGIVDDQLVIMMRSEYKNVTLKDYVASDLATYTTRLRQYYSGIDPDAVAEDVEEETIAQLVSNIEKKLATEYEISAEDKSRVKRHILSIEDIEGILNKDFSEYKGLINTNTRRINLKVFSDEETQYEELRLLKTRVQNKIDSNARALVNLAIYGEDNKGGYNAEAEKIADETIAKIKNLSDTFFESINACKTSEEIDEVVYGEGAILTQMTSSASAYKETSALFSNSRSGAWIAEQNLPFGMLQMTYMDSPVKSSVAGVILTWYRSIMN